MQRERLDVLTVCQYVAARFFLIFFYGFLASSTFGCPTQRPQSAVKTINIHDWVGFAL